MDFPARDDSTLDLILTSHPSHKILCKSLPPTGLRSGHDVVLYDTSLQAVRAKPVKRKIYLWKRADTVNIKLSLSNNSKSFKAETFNCVEDMWQNFNATIDSTMEKFVIFNMYSFSHAHPWINTRIRRATRRTQRVHRKAKTSRKKKDWDRYRNL